MEVEEDGKEKNEEEKEEEEEEEMTNMGFENDSFFGLKTIINYFPKAFLQELPAA